MASTDPAAAILPIDLGAASAYSQRIFPLAYYEPGNNVTKGSILIKATLEEMEKIKELGIDLNKNDDFIFNTRLKLEALRAKKETLQDNGKTLNPFKAFMNYRAARLFHAASKALLIQTRRTSEKIRREEQEERVERVQVVPPTRIRVVEGEIPPGAMIGGIIVELPNGWNVDAEQAINDATETIVTSDPFQDNSLHFTTGRWIQIDEHAISLANTESILTQDSDADEGDGTSAASTDLQRSHPTSPRPINLHIYHNSIVAPHSNLTGPAVNTGSHNSGASVTQQFSP
ncbi:hypothetical protein J3R82DRAFT_10999 [Butyriboletus roseoflavus]|nr:hypothetical protein J3R82DRAFT_10999 [Butyriboletus roseoflavus]